MTDLIEPIARAIHKCPHSPIRFEPCGEMARAALAAIEAAGYVVVPRDKLREEIAAWENEPDA